MKAARPTAALAATLVVIAGCGGGSTDEFRQQASAICAEYETLIRAVPAPASNPELVDSASEVAGLIEEGTAKLRRLDAPGSLEDDYDEWLALNEEAAANARDISAAAAADDQARIRELAVLAERNESDANALARGLGLDACVTGEDEAAGT